MISRFFTCVCLVLTGILLYSHQSAATQVSGTTAVPFIGCKSDGQVGPLDAPKSGIQVRVANTYASQLAVYKAQNGLAVLGPRGWNCFGTYGSSGATLYVTPEPLRSEVILSTEWKGLNGFGVEAVTLSGGTSGRLGVARILAQVFPAQKAFVDRVIAEGVVPASSFSFSPSPSDQLTHRSDHVIEVRTPPRSQGLGTWNHMLPNNDPIRGVAILIDGEPDLSMLMLRLPQNLNNLDSTILSQFESEYLVPPLGR